MTMDPDRALVVADERFTEASSSDDLLMTVDEALAYLNDEIRKHSAIFGSPGMWAAADALAAEVRRLDGMRCDNGPCKYRATVSEAGSDNGDPDYMSHWCCVMPDSPSVDDVELRGPSGVNALCDALGGGCRAWSKRDA